MRKIPTIFERDWEGDRSRVTEEPTPGCEWVFAGEGKATRKYDGTACMVENGLLYKRHEVREGREVPVGFMQVDDDLMTGKTVGWLPVGSGPEDKWHREAFAHRDHWADSTYELVGPKIQGNPEKYTVHTLIDHQAVPTWDVPRTFEGLKESLESIHIEGFVFQHPDGRMAKIKARDFGIKR